ncbi:DUF7255 family protein [Echinicola vietnamensis]|uniref:Uncharacterized protein n=1 Tax=Echinicola vietnamensis (strain DSM 17526 / LMG 23754 / KMM 6221) TaxID=926556 RepID=L0G3H8_ECHVK|nr:hypothetical protein [Echinicola vietnamensis]AGA79526.1 hypothetical protein Echvi_3302 [Echinicola vietnamensis DSM 17526]
MHQLKVQNLIKVLLENKIELEEDFRLEINKKLLDDKALDLQTELYACLGGIGSPILLDRLRFDFRIDRMLFIYDDAVHFNRYRLATLKTSVYEVFTFSWLDSYKRLCRTFERECHKAGLHDRIWNGPPIASKCFGSSMEPGDLTGNGAAGWKLNAYNDAQYDLLTRLHGYKIIRIPMYENIMTGGSLKKIDQLLLNPKEENYNAILNWLQRKTV